LLAVYGRDFLDVRFADFAPGPDGFGGAGRSGDARHSVIHAFTLASGLARRRGMVAVRLVDGIDDPPPKPLASVRQSGQRAQVP
jgi:hypothetical protein